MATQVILLERVESLGAMGDVVSVKPGYARNYLLPQKKALRASKQNIAFFEAQRKVLEADNSKKRAEAEKLAKKIEGTKVPLIRQASEGGQLYGSVAARDIAEQLAKETGLSIEKSMVALNQSYKNIGLFDVAIILHPEVRVLVTVNIARSAEEAETQAKTGVALVAGARAAQESLDDAKALEGVLEDSALEAHKEKQAEENQRATEDAEKAEVKAAKRAVKKAKTKADEADETETNAMQVAVETDEDDE